MPRGIGIIKKLAARVAQQLIDAVPPGTQTLAQVLAQGQIANDFIDFTAIAAPVAPAGGVVRLWPESNELRARFGTSAGVGLSIRNLATNGVLFASSNNLGLAGGEGGTPGDPHMVFGPGGSITMGSLVSLGWAANPNPTQVADDVAFERDVANRAKVTDGGAGLGDFLVKDLFFDGASSLDVKLSTSQAQLIVTAGDGSSGQVASGDFLVSPGGSYFLDVSGNNAFITSGSGTPEGVVTGSVGCVFMRLDGGASTTLYVKESGVGNTGWVAK